MPPVKSRFSLVSIAVAAALMTNYSPSLYAGQIITDAPEGEALASATSESNKQFGFGGWDMGNVEVNRINTLDLTPTDGTYDKGNGTYSPMFLGESFSSALSVDGEVRGTLHGKKFPVGEPAGVKVLNGDLATKDGKPQNCIMTTSYLESGYLEEGNKPVLCSSGFQTHKRFKIRLLPSTVANTSSGEGLPVEMTFNLKEGDSSTQRYQVLQKINNYSGKRLDGYKIEVFDANGLPNPELTLSDGTGEGIESDGSVGNIWEVNQKANFSHGLWGPVDHHFDRTGFLTTPGSTMRQHSALETRSCPIQAPCWEEITSNCLATGSRRSGNPREYSMMTTWILPQMAS